jgi:hypothetical protein
LLASTSHKKAIIIGIHPLRGGLASFDERLARQFQDEGYETMIYTFSLQYPNFLFQEPHNIQLNLLQPT